MGGEITIKLVTLHPDRVLSAVIGGAGWLREHTLSHEAYMDVAEMLSALRPGDSIVEAMGGLSHRSDEDREIFDDNDPQALAALAEGQLALEVSEGELRSNGVPALAVMGEHDSVRQDIEALSEVMSNLSMEVLPGQTHGSAFSDPKFIDLVEAFLVEMSDGTR